MARLVIKGLAACILSFGLLQAPSVQAAPKAQVYANEEYGYRLIFPAGSQVCPGTSGAHVHGYYALYGHPSPYTCGQLYPKASAISIWADYNAGFKAAPYDCDPPTASSHISDARLKTLSFKGLASVQCAEDKPDGSIEITVATGAGRVVDDGVAMPAIYYRLSLQTYPDRLDSDLVLFRTVLASGVITPPRLQ